MVADGVKVQWDNCVAHENVKKYASAYCIGTSKTAILEANLLQLVAVIFEKTPCKIEWRQLGVLCKCAANFFSPGVLKRRSKRD